MGRTACTEPHCLYKGALYLTFQVAFIFRCSSLATHEFPLMPPSLSKLIMLRTFLCKVHFYMLSYFLRATLVSERKKCRGWSQWPRGLEPGSASVRLLGLRFRIPPRALKSFFYGCCVLSGRVLCFGLIIRPEDPYRVWVCESVCVTQCGQVRQ